MWRSWTHAFAVASGFLLALLLGSLGIIGTQHDAITRHEHVLHSSERSDAALCDRVAALDEGCCAARRPRRLPATSWNQDRGCRSASEEQRRLARVGKRTMT